MLTLNFSRFGRVAYVQKPNLELVNGLLLKYNRANFALRILMSYWQHTIPNVYMFGSYENAKSTSRDFRLGLGTQFKVLKRAKGLYVFSDLLYRRVLTYSESNVGGQNLAL